MEKHFLPNERKFILASGQLSLKKILDPDRLRQTYRSKSEWNCVYWSEQTSQFHNSFFFFFVLLLFCLTKRKNL